MKSIAENIAPYIPQRTPFIMVDELVNCNDEEATSKFTIVKENVFVAGTHLEEVALVENIAQTAAARIGYRSAQEQKPVPVGFIGAVQNLIIYRKAQLGETLYTTIKIKNQIFNATIIEGEARIDKEIIASCTMKIFIPSY